MYDFKMGDKVWCASYRTSDHTYGKKKFTEALSATITGSMFEKNPDGTFKFGADSYIILYKDEFGEDEDTYGGDELFTTKEECEKWIKEQNTMKELT